MRIAILADIHGNLRALDAVLAALPAHAPDLTVNLGDHVSGPLQAAGVASRLMASRILHIRGNHDRQLLDRPVEAMGASDAAAYPRLTAAHKAWLAQLPPLARPDPGILLCHGTPSNDLAYLLEEVTPHGVRLADAELVARRLGTLTEPRPELVLCGHTHVPRVVELPGGPLIVNPGSVGLPAYDDTAPYPHVMETGSPQARYALADRVRGRWQVGLFCAGYEADAAAREAAAAGRPDWAYALRTGYALRTPEP